MSLSQKLQDKSKRHQVVLDAQGVLDAEVADKRGVSGLAVKATFKVVKGLQPNFVYKAIDDLLDEFVGRVEPFYEEWTRDPRGKDLAGYFTERGSEVADALLAVTDGRAEKSRHKNLVKAYGKLRPKGKEHVQAAMPRVGAMMDRQTREFR